MSTYKAGYFIDEFVLGIEELVGKDTLEKFWDQHLIFEISNLPSYISEEASIPLQKVAWNLISRGAPTRASINVSENILACHLDEYYLGTNTDGPEISFKIDPEFFKEIDPNILSNILSNFSQLSEEVLAKDFGTKYLKIYRVLIDLIAVAQVQKTILLLILSDLGDGRREFIIRGIRESLKETIIEDLNNLFKNLNKLITEDEDSIPKISLGSSENCISIDVNTSTGSTYEIRSFQDSNYFDRVLTDRKIDYKSLGGTVEEVENEKNVQRFEYVDESQKSALLFFLRNIFRKKEFWPGQEAIINRAIQDEDVIGLLPTGGGKSLTYQICALLQPGVTIVVDPINSLMKDQYDNLIGHGINKTTFINSFNTKEEREKYLNGLAEGKYLILFVSPERFQIQKFRESLSSCYNNSVYYSYAVIDEAHCVSEWGHDFRHTYLNLAQNLKRFCKPKTKELTLFGLTATASFDVLADVQRELEMPENAIISLPAEAIDRKELNFEILKVDAQIAEGQEYWERVNGIGTYKYPMIKSAIRRMPEKIRQLETSDGYLNSSTNFFEEQNGKYSDAGVIFCPTKSNKLKNGVLRLYDFLEEEEYLEIGTFFGSGDDNTIRNDRVEKEALQSINKQEEFINNDTNLMIATKAFGMGIDKPNIRYTFHYTFPNSVESFYQEAGRAGRNGKPSICHILYHPKDIQTNYDFYQNSFKGIKREREIIEELLGEIKYEDNFYVNVLRRIVQDKFPKVNYINLWNDRYLDIFGPYKEDPEKRIHIGRIDLKYNDLRSYDDFRKNFEVDDSEEILSFVRKVLAEEATGQDYIGWLQTKSADGIKTLIESNRQDKYELRIGFTNDVVSNMTQHIKNVGHKDFESVVIKAAYNFSADAKDFIENLHFRYHQFTDYNKELRLNKDTIQYLKNNYYRIRNSYDTQRAIYRLSVIGVIDDYVIDYVGNLMKVRFKAKSDSEYLENFESYLKRYLGRESTQKWLDKAVEREGTSTLKNTLYTLIEFIEEEISEKRKRAIDYMQQLCEIGYERGDQPFRENIVYYFTSKYARLDYLPKDTDGGKIESVEIVKKYLNYISNPPDNLGGEINNAKHLRGACENLRITMTNDNASIDLLSAYSLFALEASESDNLEEALRRPLINKAIELYRKGFQKLLQIESWSSVKDLLKLFNNKVLDINPVIEPLIDPLMDELLLNRTTYRLNKFLNKLSHHERQN